MTHASLLCTVALLAAPATGAGVLEPAVLTLDPTDAPTSMPLTSWEESARHAATSRLPAFGAASVTLTAREPLPTGLHGRVWATMLTGVSVNATLQVEHQILSVMRFSVYPHITLVTPEVLESARARVRKAGSHIVDVTLIAPPGATPDAWFSDVYTKLHIFNLKGFNHIAYIDSDAMLMREGADGIFDACIKQGDPPLCGVPDGQKTATGHSMINAGVLVVKPSEQTYHSLLSEMNTTVIGRFNEQELLSVYFAKRGLQYLEPEFNSCHPGSSIEDVAIMHVCGDVKVNELPFCAWEEMRGFGVSQSPSRMCESKALRLAQDLLLEARPCVFYNHDASGKACAAAASEGCGWCGFEIGCTESEQCHLNSDATQNMLERRRTSPSTAFGKWSVLSNNEPEKFGTMIPDYHNTLVTIAMLSCNRLPFLKLALAQIEKNRREGNPADFGVATEVVIVDDSPAGSHTDRKIVKELSTRYPRFQLMYEHEVPKWSYTNRSVRLMDGSTLPHVAAFHENVAKTHSAQMPLVVRLLKLKTRKSIGEKRTLVQRPAFTSVVRQNGFSPNSLSEDVDFVERSIRSCHRFYLHDCYDRQRSGYVYTRHGSIEGTYHGKLSSSAQDSTWSWADGVPDYLPMTEAAQAPEWLSDDLRWEYANAERQVTAIGEVCTAPNHTELAQPKLVANVSQRMYPRMPRQCCATPLEPNIDDGCWNDFLKTPWDQGNSGFGHYSFVPPSGFQA